MCFDMRLFYCLFCFAPPRGKHIPILFLYEPFVCLPVERSHWLYIRGCSLTILLMAREWWDKGPCSGGYVCLSIHCSHTTSQTMLIRLCWNCGEMLSLTSVLQHSLDCHETWGNDAPHRYADIFKIPVTGWQKCATATGQTEDSCAVCLLLFGAEWSASFMGEDMIAIAEAGAVVIWSTHSHTYSALIVGNLLTFKTSIQQKHLVDL